MFFDDVDDTRACGDCTCGQPDGGSCLATITVYGEGADAGCNLIEARFEAGGCLDLSGNPQVGQATVEVGPPDGGNAEIDGGPCASDGGQPRVFSRTSPGTRIWN